MESIKITPESLFEAFQKATDGEKARLCELVEKYKTWNEDEIRQGIIEVLNGSKNAADIPTAWRKWLTLATAAKTGPADLKPRYVEGKGIYVPVVGKYLAMEDSFDGEEVTWYKAKEAGINAPTRDEWYIILFFKDEINRLLRENGGEELNKWYWTSTEYSEVNAWAVYASNGNVYLNTKYNQNSVRAWAASE